MGSKITEEKQKYAALNNCAFVSLKDAKDSQPFTFLMDCAMLGVGVGFDTKASLPLYHPQNKQKQMYQITDDREGWVKSVGLLIDSYLKPGQNEVNFDYSLIRGPGIRLKTFGGISSGSQPLINLHKDIRALLSQNVEKGMGSKLIVDVMNMIGQCVVSGNVRRTAEIAFGEPDDKVFLDLKNYEKYPERASYGWTSNNSILAKLGQDYSEIAERIIYNGEPGIAWLENMRNYSRMCDAPDYKDIKALGGNPCLEQTLESYELCNLVETFPAKHNSYEEFEETLKSAFLYAKVVTLGDTD